MPPKKLTKKAMEENINRKEKSGEPLNDEEKAYEAKIMREVLGESFKNVQKVDRKTKSGGRWLK